MYDPEIPITRSLLEAACREIRTWKVDKGGDDQVVLNLEAAIKGFDRFDYEFDQGMIDTLQRENDSLRNALKKIASHSTVADMHEQDRSNKLQLLARIALD